MIDLIINRIIDEIESSFTKHAPLRMSQSLWAWDLHARVHDEYPAAVLPALSASVERAVELGRRRRTRCSSCSCSSAAQRCACGSSKRGVHSGSRLCALSRPLAQARRSRRGRHRVCGARRGGASRGRAFAAESATGVIGQCLALGWCREHPVRWPLRRRAPLARAGRAVVWWRRRQLGLRKKAPTPPPDPPPTRGVGSGILLRGCMIAGG